MDVTETLKKIKALFVDVPPVAPVAPVVPVENAAPIAPSYTLQDGTAVEIDKLEVGGIVKIAGMTAAAGDYTLTDGTILTTDANGVITNVTAAAPAAPVTPIVPTPVNPPGTNNLFAKELTIEEMKAIRQEFAIGGADERIARLETLCSALMENVFGWQLQEIERQTTAKQAIEAYAGVEAGLETSGQLMSKYNEAVQGLFAVVETLAKTPAAAPLESQKDGFKKDKFNAKEEKVAQIAKAVEDIKKKTL